MSGGGADLIVGTAGHIDHGKTSLVRLLTGQDLDSQPQEQERGITIALGFAPLDLADGRRLAFVDVPGHERLVRTMVAGATGIDAVLLCVSADDGVMPQTREHLAILNLLGLSQGAVVLTKADLVDEELLELAIDDVTDLLQGTFLEGKPIVPVSNTTGAGRDGLIEVLSALQRNERDPSGPFRLPVDRAFTRTGFGTVATGTVWSGTLHDGEVVQLLPAGREVRVRGIQVHGQASKQARPGWRLALNLSGVEKGDVPRGTVVSRGFVPCPYMVDAWYHHLPGAPVLLDGASVRMLLGTTECLGRVYLMTEGDSLDEGASANIQLRLDSPVPCVPGDRFVLRRTSPVSTLGGGQVVDPYAPKLRRKGRVLASEQVDRLRAGDHAVWLERAGESGVDGSSWARRGVEDVGVELAGVRFAAPVVARLTGALLESLSSYHRAHPLSLGAHRRELLRGRLAHLDERVFDALVERLDALRSVHIDGPILRQVGFEVRLTPDQVALQVQVAASVRAAGVGGLMVKALHEAHKEPEVAALAYLLEADGQIQQVQSLGWLDAAALRELREALGQLFQRHDELPPADFKLLTGLSRKKAIPLLEHLDRIGWTRRVGDSRVVGPNLKS